MQEKKRVHPQIKAKLHPRNKHRQRYDFEQLIQHCPELSPYVHLNKYEDTTIDFSDAEAVKMLNKALLKQFYNIDYWSIPQNYLCPPIPGRADYIHHIADVLAKKNDGQVPTGTGIRCLDIGVGANCVYPIIGNTEYGWSFVGTDIDAVAIKNAQQIIDANSDMEKSVTLRLQSNPKDIFKGLIQVNEHFDLSICNPPFHASAEEARDGALRKLSSLQRKDVKKATLNFGGVAAELWCNGGEQAFIKEMILQSKTVGTSCYWFSTIISKKENLQGAYKALKELQAVEILTVPMGQGTKISRFVAWTFLSPKQQARWIEKRWNNLPK